MSAPTIYGLLAAIYDADLRTPEKAMLFAAARRAGTDGLMFASVADWARGAGLKPRRARLAIRHLEAIGALVLMSKARGGRDTSRYRIDIDAIRVQACPASGAGVTPAWSGTLPGTACTAPRHGSPARAAQHAAKVANEDAREGATEGTRARVSPAAPGEWNIDAMVRAAGGAA